ncbi:hypothetical protein [Paenibacillus sp. y28]|uniref:hypothetical protein n=1 Tax=Paenibacillus sp. y28 TaxID=3129110 RepID=UPI00301A957F
MSTKELELSGTFVLNKRKPIHRWYPYSEGYSYPLVEKEVIRIGKKIDCILDPFGGSGTTPLVASQKGIRSYYTEMNPFMRFVADTKINSVIESNQDTDEILTELLKLRESLPSIITQSTTISEFGGFEKFFDIEILRQIKNYSNFIDDANHLHPLTVRFANFALACVAVSVSNMVRRTDLRYAREDEKKEYNKNFTANIMDKLTEIITDIKDCSRTLISNTSCLGEDARYFDSPEKIDVVVTSPPYLNGTNYIRNTKLELKLMKLIEKEDDLKTLHSKGIVAGINNVSKRNIIPHILPETSEYVEKLEADSYDLRIPKMVAGYFYDMNNVFENLHRQMKSGGTFVLDIGDSQFAGVHIPTHEILQTLAVKNGFHFIDEEILRTRRSKNGMVLSQRVLRFQNN